MLSLTCVCTGSVRNGFAASEELTPSACAENRLDCSTKVHCQYCFWSRVRTAINTVLLYRVSDFNGAGVRQTDGRTVSSGSAAASAVDDEDDRIAGGAARGEGPRGRRRLNPHLRSERGRANAV